MQFICIIERTGHVASVTLQYRSGNPVRYNYRYNGEAKIVRLLCAWLAYCRLINVVMRLGSLLKNYFYCRVENQRFSNGRIFELRNSVGTTCIINVGICLAAVSYLGYKTVQTL